MMNHEKIADEDLLPLLKSKEYQARILDIKIWALYSKSSGKRKLDEIMNAVHLELCNKDFRHRIFDFGEKIPKFQTGILSQHINLKTQQAS